jgi:TonB family protein
MKAFLMGLLMMTTQGAQVTARFANGQAPALPPLAQNGGVAGLELVVARSGIVQDAVVIDDSPPFTEEMRRVVRLWQFETTSAEGATEPARVAVVGLFRAPTLLGGAPPPPKRVSTPSPEIPYPVSTATPAYPPKALSSGVVMLEVEVDEKGAVSAVEMLNLTEGFDAVAVEAARKFRFQPAKLDGRPVRSFAVVVFGFPQPVTSLRPR